MRLDVTDAFRNEPGCRELKQISISTDSRFMPAPSISNNGE